MLNPVSYDKSLICQIPSYPLHCSQLHPSSRILMDISTIIGEYKVSLSLSISPCHKYVLTLSAAYTKFGIYHERHTQCTGCAMYHIHLWWIVFPSFSWSQVALSVSPWLLAYLPTDWLPPASSPRELKGNVNLSQSHSRKLTYQWIDAQHPLHSPLHLHIHCLRIHHL